MSQKIKYLYDNKQISSILAEGFAKICQQKPKFPINYLARYLKNHTIKNDQKVSLIDRLQSNSKINQKLTKQKETIQEQLLQKLQKEKVKSMDKDNFLHKISSAQRHEEVLDYFCQWIHERLGLAGVYIGQLEHQVKKINLAEEDSQDAHLELEKQKIIKFKYSSEGQKKVVVGKILSQESVVGKLLNEPQGQQPPADEEGCQGQEAKSSLIKGQIYIASVVGNTELKFFRFPKLGSYFASTLTIKSYLKQKLFDQNTLKVESYRKVLHDFEKEMEEKQAKFKETYDEKVNAGAEEKELEEIQKEFEREKSQIKRPVQQDFSFYERRLVICTDTLGLDREISQNEKEELRSYISHLKQSWQSQQKSQLQKDIDNQLSLSKTQHDQAHQPQIQNYQQQYTTLLQEEQKQIPSHEEVQKVKDNEKLFELESNTVRIEKIKQYLVDEKYIKFWDHLLEMNVVKYHQVIKQFLVFLGFKKEEFCFKGTNVLDWQRTKNLIRTQNSKIFERLNTTNARGSRPDIVQPYAKCSRITKNLEGLQPITIASYNIYLSFILRLLQLYTKTRFQDRETRLTRIQAQKQLRQQKLKQAEDKTNEKKEKLQALKADLEEKGELEAFDEEAWNMQYDEENPAVEVPEEVTVDIDRDLEDVPEGDIEGHKETNIDD